MSRGLWFVAGAGAGVYAMVRGRRAARGVHRRRPARPAGRRSPWARGCSATRSRQGKAEKETELRERFGLVPHGHPSWRRGRHRPPRTGDRHDDEEGSN